MKFLYVNQTDKYYILKGDIMSDFLKSVIKDVGNEYATLVADGIEAGDVDTFIDTGSYVFNALLSGSLNGGLPSNKITALAGESATGKTCLLYTSPSPRDRG